MQFIVVLLGSDPLVWRRIIVPLNYSFWDLHVALQDAMGWADSHLHQFDFVHFDPASAESKERSIGIPDLELDRDPETEAGWELKVIDFMNWHSKPIRYWYDFGDDWHHMLGFEGVKDPKCNSPICTGGSGACPPEDVGGIPGYEEFLSIVGNRSHPDRQARFDWYRHIQSWKLRVGESLIERQMNLDTYDPQYFDPADVWFDDPAERLRKALG